MTARVTGVIVPMQIQKVLGKGSYGTAYKGKRLSDGKTYAIKVPAACSPLCACVQSVHC